MASGLTTASVGIGRAATSDSGRFAANGARAMTTPMYICRVLSGPFLLMLVVAAFGANQRTSIAYSGWRTYSNSDYGVSFRYPPTMKMLVLNPQAPGIPNLVLRIVLKTKSKPMTNIVGLFVLKPDKNSMVLYPSKAFLKKTCRNYGELKYGGYEVLRCVSCGRAACSWTMYHLGRFAYEWVDIRPKTPRSYAPGNHGYPVLDIIKSAHYAESVRMHR